MDPPGEKILYFQPTTQHNSWEPHTKAGWTLGPSLQNHKCLTIADQKSMRPQISNQIRRWHKPIYPPSAPIPKQHNTSNAPYHQPNTTKPQPNKTTNTIPTTPSQLTRKIPKTYKVKHSHALTSTHMNHTPLPYTTFHPICHDATTHHLPNTTEHKNTNPT